MPMSTPHVALQRAYPAHPERFVHGPPPIADASDRRLDQSAPGGRLIKHTVFTPTLDPSLALGVG